MSGIEDVCKRLEDQGIIGYYIEANGFFRSNFCYPPIIQEISGTTIPVLGDALLRLWSDKSTISLYWPDASGYMSSVYKNVQSIDMFQRGLPLYGQAPTPTVERHDSTAKVWAIFEQYGPNAKAQLSSYGTTAAGLKVTYSTQQHFVIGGRDQPGTSTHTLYPYEGTRDTPYMFTWQLPGGMPPRAGLV